MNGTVVATGLAGVAALLLFFKLLRARKKSVRNKVVLITGASSGLGEACAHLFYRCGAKVILCARRMQELERVKEALISVKLSGECHEPKILAMDLADLEALPSKAKQAFDFHQRIDILINNAGMSSRGDVLSTSMEVEMRVMTVNYFGTVALTKAVLPYMISQKSGHIVAVSSIQGRLALPFRSTYGASKHAVQAFCDSLRAEVAEHNIGVSVFSPSYIKTNLSLNAVNGDGSTHGALDEVIDTGMDVEVAAKALLGMVEYDRTDLLLGPFLHVAGVYARVLLPSVVSRDMRARAERKFYS